MWSTSAVLFVTHISCFGISFRGSCIEKPGFNRPLSVAVSKNTFVGTPSTTYFVLGRNMATSGFYCRRSISPFVKTLREILADWLALHSSARTELPPPNISRNYDRLTRVYHIKSYSRTDLLHLRYLDRKHLEKVSLYSLKVLGFLKYEGIRRGKTDRAMEKFVHNILPIISSHQERKKN